MEAKTKKRIIIGSTIGILLIGTLLIVKRVKDLLNYSIKFSTIKFKELTGKKILFDIIVQFKNMSDLTLDIKNQEYDVYINNVFITTIKSDKEQIILAKSSSPITVTVDLNTKDLLTKLGSLGDGSPSNLLKTFVTFKEQNLKIVYKFGIKFGYFTIPVKFSYNDKIANWK